MPSEFVSEPLVPLAGTFDAAAMATGLPGLPRGFVWRDQTCEITAVLESWKESSREGGHAQGELYLRRHYWRLKMHDGATWVVYCLRQTKYGAAARRRWFLLQVEP